MEVGDDEAWSDEETVVDNDSDDVTADDGVVVAISDDEADGNVVADADAAADREGDGTTADDGKADAVGDSVVVTDGDA